MKQLKSLKLDVTAENGFVLLSSYQLLHACSLVSRHSPFSVVDSHFVWCKLLIRTCTCVKICFCGIVYVEFGFRQCGDCYFLTLKHACNLQMARKIPQCMEFYRQLSTSQLSLIAKHLRNGLQLPSFVIGVEVAQCAVNFCMYM